MRLDEILKQLKKIEPDADYARKSRLLILSQEPLPRRGIFTRVLVHNLQFGAAVAVMAVVLFLIFGGSPLFNAITPFKGSALDPTGLRAEAQDIDIQVQLAKLNYQETVPSPLAIKKISEVVTQNSKDLNSLKELNAQIAASTPSLATSSTSSISSSSEATSTGGATQNETSTPTGAETSSTETSSTSKAASSTNLTPDQVLEQLSK